MAGGSKIVRVRQLWLWFATVALCCGRFVSAQEETVCYGPGSMAASVLLTLICTLVLLYVLYVLWKKYKQKAGQHLILEKDPERGKDGFAFDNHGFKDTGLTPIGKALEKNKLDSAKAKWNQWSPLTVLTTKHEKRKTMDDSTIENNEVKIVSLRSHDFTGLGFNICGNMRDGIYIKDILHRGPASESGKLNAGDRINSVTISFEHMVYEDALTILSYASPYEVIIEANKSGKILSSPGQMGQPGHPLFKSSSSTDLLHIGKSAKKRLFQAEDHGGSINSNYSSLQKAKSNNTSLERNNSKSPKLNNQKGDWNKKSSSKIQLSPKQLKTQLEQKILSCQKHNEKINGEKPNKIQLETQKTESRFQKFGVKVLPNDGQLQKSPKTIELSQNDNNINSERNSLPIQPRQSIDEVDQTSSPPSVKRREKQKPADNTVNFERQNSLTGSGIKRDKDGIPQEIPNHMMNAAIAARKNRKSSIEKEDPEVVKTPKKLKGKAPAPPEERTKSDENLNTSPVSEIHSVEISKINFTKEYNSDSDLETDNQSSVNTIELNASEITIHQSEENDEKQNRRTASTGDLTKIQKGRKTSTGTLERAQSLDIADTTMPSLNKKRKAGRIEDNLDSKTSSDESLYGIALIKKEPRLSLILDGLNTFQRNRLKKSTEWGNLEDAILKLNSEEGSLHKSSLTELSSDNSSIFSFGEKSPELDALVNRINEIKKESPEKADEKEQNIEQKNDMNIKSVKNQIWPTFSVKDEVINLETNHIEEFRPTEKLKSEGMEVTEDKIDDVQKQPAKVIEEEKKVKPFLYSPLDDSNDFIKAEQRACALNMYFISHKTDDINISDDIKVSRHTLGSVEIPKSDDLKLSTPALKTNHSNVSNITISDNNNVMNNESNCASLEINVGKTPVKQDTSHISTSSELYTTALDEPIKNTPERVIISTPDLIKNVTIAEAIHDLNAEVTIEGPSSFEIPGDQNELTEATFTSLSSNSNLDIENLNDTNEQNINEQSSPESNINKNSTLTYITEIQVMTPNNGSSNNNGKSENISEIEIIPNVNISQCRNLDHEFENYVKNFETVTFSEEPIVETKQPKSITIDPEKELHKIQEIAEEQLKKLPEMRFSTSSYESSKVPEKRQSQIELLRSNFEKSPVKNAKIEGTPKSRIPIATNKTPPTSPERRDSRNLDLETDKALMEMMSTSIHSTPAANFKYQPKHSNKNVSITSIRNNSKIPSGLPTLGGSKPSVPPRRSDSREDGLVHISTNGGTESSFKQWVFNPSDSITNISVSEHEKK